MNCQDQKLNLKIVNLNTVQFPGECPSPSSTSNYTHNVIVCIQYTQLEVEGWERLCQAKDKLLEEKNAENMQMIEKIGQKLEELGTDPQLLQVITCIV